ncbi:MAG: UDP-N-acetylmuramate--L-alanine ligase [Pseudomonadota bacterium]
MRHIHFVGVGGAGMSALAEVWHRLGYEVSGSDAQASPVTERLAALGVRVFIGHAAAQIEGAQVVVASSAVKADNPELAAARACGIPVVARAELLAELLRARQGIAVAGTHGKTTTSALVAGVLAEAGCDPSFVIGGELLAAGANARLGAGAFIVVEADESDASFLHLAPVLSVVTNIDADHMETYGHSVERLRDAFVAFVGRLPFYGRAVLCVDDPGVQAIVPRLARPVLGYGLGAAADVRATAVEALAGGGMRFVALRRDPAAAAALPPLPLTLALAGEHNVRNALAAISVAMVLGLPDAAVAAALHKFAGVGRRFQRWGALRTADGGRCELVDDYGHHPAEMAAVLAAARGAFARRRIVLAFQPHRYTRTRDCFADFADVIGRFDAALLTAVYAAGEAPIAGADGRALAAAVPGARYVADRAALPAAVAETVRDGDVLVVMGAGSIAELPRRLLQTMGDAR